MERISTTLSVEAVVENIKHILADKQITLFTVFDHALEAGRLGLQLSATQVVVFGDPKVGTMLMQEDNAVALDLPLKLLVFEDSNQTWIAFSKPSLLADQYDLHAQKAILLKMDTLLEQIAQEASK
jgi:uncharacterized protein (DUF302 family)